MKAMFWIGTVLLILGIVSLVVPLPGGEREGIRVGGLSVGVETRHDRRMSPILSAVLIVGGVSAMIVGKMKAGSTA